MKLGQRDGGVARVAVTSAAGTFGEAELLAAYRRLPAKRRRRLREAAREFETLARTEKRSRK